MQKNFAVLHLSARDFIGLSLDQALEKIARAYLENRNEAGAYSALIEILGKKSAPQLLEALRQLGIEGFDGLRAKNQNLSDTLKTEAADALNSLTRTFSEYTGRMKNFLGNLAGGFLEALQMVGGLGAAAFNWVQGVKTDWDEVLLLNKKTNAALESQNVQLEAAKKHTEDRKVSTEDILTLQDKLLRSQIETTQGEAKKAALADEYVSLMLRNHDERRNRHRLELRN